MNSKEFLEKLDGLLQGIPEEERAEALCFYSEYFSEGGPEQEQAILQELVSPEHVAAAILQSLPDTAQASPKTAAEVPEEVAEVPASELSAIPVPVYSQRRGDSSFAASRPPERDSSNQQKSNHVLLILLLAVITSPIWLSLLSSLLGILVAVLVTGLSLIVAGVFTVFAPPVVLLLNLGTFASIGIGSNLMGLGLVFLTMALGLLLAGVGGFLLFWLFPLLIKAGKKLFDLIRGKRGGIA